jgi:glutathione S-transferase
MPASAHRLVTLVFSHYNEKARWALDYCGIDYEERAYMPGFSQLGVMLATRGRGGAADDHSTRWSTPILVTRDGEALCDSTAIARWASAQLAGDPLFPNAGVVDMVDSLGRELGPHTRLAAYWHVLPSKTAMRTMAERNVSKRQALAYRVISPLVSPLIRKGLGVTEKRYHRSVAKVREQIALAEERLARHPYLAGDRFTAADLTFATMLAPALRVSQEEGYFAAMPQLDELRDEARALVEEIRATRGGKFALEMFRRYRHARHAEGETRRFANEPS